MLQRRIPTSLAGVDGFVTIMESCDTSRAFFRGSVNRFKENFESKFFVLFYHFRQAGFINGKSFFPTFLFQFLFSAHLINVSSFPKSPFSKGGLRRIIIPNSAVCNPQFF